MKKRNGFFKKLVAVAASAAICLGCMAIPGNNVEVQAKSNEPLPSNIIVGYWHNFKNNSNIVTKLRDVNPEWDVINVSFMMTNGDRHTAIFEPDKDVYPGTLEERIEEFKSDVKYLQSQGKHVCISLGGETGSISLPNDAAKDTFLETSMAILEEYGFDGFDVDLEGSSVTMSSGDTVDNCSSPIQVYLVEILHKIKAHFGDDFIISMAPEHPYVQGGAIGWGSPWGAYLPFLNNCRDILTYIHPQYYNNGIAYDTADGYNCSGFNANSYVVLSEMLINGFDTAQGHFDGLRPDQVAIGVPCGPGAAGTGIASISEYQEAFKTLLQKYPDFRGMMTWSTNWDEHQGNKFVLGMRSVIDQYGDNDLGIRSITADVTGRVEVGSTVTWTAVAKNTTGAVSYDFDLFKDGTMIQNGSYGSASTFSTVISEPGEYYVTVTAKDSSNKPISKTSETLTAYVGVLKLNSITADQSGAIAAGKAITYTADASGGLAPLKYSFQIYNGSDLVAQSGSSASNTFRYIPENGGNYKATVTVTDSQGNTRSMTSSSIFVTVSLAITDLALDKNSVSVGTSVTCTVKTKGGDAFNTYSYYVLKNGKVINKVLNSDNASCTFTPSESGTYQIRVYVQDGRRHRVVDTVRLTVR